LGLVSPRPPPRLAPCHGCERWQVVRHLRQSGRTVCGSGRGQRDSRQREGRMVTEFHRAAHREHGGAFGSGGFGAFAESIARFFGTPQYLISQTFLVALWI